MLKIVNRLRYLPYRIGRLEAHLAEIGTYLSAEEVGYQQARGQHDFVNSNQPLAGQWTRLCQDLPSHTRARALVSFNSSLLAGFDTGQAMAADLWQFTDHWTLLRRWDGCREVNALATSDKEVFVGITAPSGAQVWAYDGEWRQIGRPGTDWSTDQVGVSALHHRNGTLYACLATDERRLNGKDLAPVHAWRNGRWSRVGGDWGHPYVCVYELTEHDGHLFAGTFGVSGNNGHVWRLGGDRWEMVGGNGANGSWRTSPHVLRFTRHQGRLVAVMNRTPLAGGDYSSIWSYDGDEWCPVGAWNVPSRWADLYSFNAVISYRGHLIVGAGGRPAGNSSLWRLEDGEWRLFAGYGKGWGQRIVRRMNQPMHPGGTSEYVYRLIEHEGDLIVGFGAGPGTGQVWRLTSSD